MKMYHYVSRPNTVLKDGLLSFAKNSDADLSYYYKRSGGETTHAGIVKWFENCFAGRSRAIRCFSEPIRYTEKSRKMFQSFLENADMFSLDLDALQKDGLIEAIYVSPALRPDLNGELPQNVDEELVKLGSVAKIDFSPIDWSVCNDERGWRFAVVRYYLLIVKNGIVPPKYLTREEQNLSVCI